MLMVYLTVIWQRRALPRGLVRFLVLASIILAIPALLLTLSRLAIAAGAFFCFAGFFFLGRRAPAVQAALWVFVIGIFCVALLLLGGDQLFSLLPPDLQKRFITVDESASVRYGIWAATFKIFLSNPLLGVGLGNYREYLVHGAGLSVAASFVPDQPESGYLKVLYEVGALGSVALVWAIWGSIKRIAENLRSPVPDVRSRAWATAAALGVFLVTFVTLFTTSDARNAFILVLLISLVNADRSRQMPSTVQSGFASRFLRVSGGADANRGI